MSKSAFRKPLSSSVKTAYKEDVENLSIKFDLKENAQDFF
jgi:hypothetical protein